MTKHTLLLAVIFLTGCAASNVASDYRFDKESTQGLVIVSLSHEGLREGERPEWNYRRIGSGEENVLLPGTWVAPLDWDSPPGKLFYVALAPGKYEFYRCGLTRTSGGAASWHVGPGGVVTNTDSSYAGFDSARYPVGSLYAEPFSIQFEIVPGRATYVGNLHFVWRGFLQKNEVRLRDRSERDLSLLHRRLPNLQPAEIRKEALPVSEGPVATDVRQR